MRPVILWFREDLRLSDHQALWAAAQSGAPVLPVYIHDTAADKAWAAGGARRWWLHHALGALAQSIENSGGTLYIFKGSAAEALKRLAEISQASGLYWSRRYAPHQIAQDRMIKADFAERLEVRSFPGRLLYEPWEVQTGSGDAYRVFTPFWKAALRHPPSVTPLPIPRVSWWRAGEAEGALEALPLSALRLCPQSPNWAENFQTHWQPGEEGAQKALATFIDGVVEDYAAKRDIPAGQTTSRLSPYLQSGEISPRQVWAALQRAEAIGTPQKSLTKFAAELGWREFSYHLLFHNPRMLDQEFNPRFAGFSWGYDAADFARWCQGQTGYPLVDAGMRELWQTGWMHNRVRMVAASFLVKHLMMDWRHGMRWFWDTLVDADIASNTASWQWIAGSGADAAPYFRIFNPSLQAKTYDPEGRYIMRYVPEAGSASGNVRPMVDHSFARTRALAAFEALKQQEGSDHA